MKIITISRRNFIKFITLFLISKDLYSSTPNKINDVRNFFDKSLKRYRFVFDSKDKIEYEVYKNKDIIKFIFKNSMFSSNLNQIRIDKNYVKNISITKIKNNIEVKFYLNQPLNLNYFSITPQDKKGHRFVVDLTTDKIIYTKKINNNKKIKKIIAIDAGHGGKDPGAVGKRGTKEKNVVYDISKRIFSELKKYKNVKPVLVRKGDYYIPLRKRTLIARENKADLFISIHADAARNRKASGSSVYVLSQKGATSEAAKWLANKENSVDLIGGLSLDDKDNQLAKILLDLSQSASIESSLSVAKTILSSLAKLNRLHSKRVEQAGFVVLKSPDIPSLLVETAFLSNSEEEKKLKSKRFREKVAKSIAKGIISSIEKRII